MININSYWAPKAPNHNWYTDQLLVDCAYYITITYKFRNNDEIIDNAEVNSAIKDLVFSPNG